MMKFRTISHLLELFVLPEVQARVASGKLTQSSLPLHVSRFHVIQGIRPGNVVVNTVQINDEVGVVVQAKVPRSVQAGEPLTLPDIDPDHCYIQRPEFEGRPATYFLYQGFLFEYHLIFDCSPGVPESLPDLDTDVKLAYPIREFVQARMYAEAVQPVQGMRDIASANWPPSPGYVPDAITAVHADPPIAKRPEFSEIVRGCFSRDYWDERLAFWEQAGFFPSRMPYITRAVEAHFQDDYAVAVYVLVPQFEGIIKDYLATGNASVPAGFKNCVNALRKLVFSRTVLLFDPDTLSVIFDFLETGSFWQNSQQIDPAEMVNRHGIAHGAFTGFESHDISLKYLILLDALAFVLLHDKMLARTL